MDGCADRQTDRQTYIQTDRQTDRDFVGQSVRIMQYLLGPISDDTVGDTPEDSGPSQSYFFCAYKFKHDMGDYIIYLLTHLYQPCSSWTNSCCAYD